MLLQSTRVGMGVAHKGYTNSCTELSFEKNMWWHGTYRRCLRYEEKLKESKQTRRTAAHAHV